MSQVLLFGSESDVHLLLSAKLFFLIVLFSFQISDASAMCLELALEGERLCKSGDCNAGVAFFQVSESTSIRFVF